MNEFIRLQLLGGKEIDMQFSCPLQMFFEKHFSYIIHSIKSFAQHSQKMYFLKPVGIVVSLPLTNKDLVKKDDKPKYFMLQ